MAANTKIEWCQHSLSPWWGCTKVSTGCAHCYAEGLDARWHAGAHWGKGAPRLQQPNFERNAMALDRKAGKRGGRETVFPSMCDPFDAEVPVEWLAEFLGIIKDTQNLIWILLTKRPENWRERLSEVVRMKVSHGDIGFLQCTGQAMAALWLNGVPPVNVWMVVSVEDQPRADQRIPPLLQIPAVVRGLSCEPLLGAVDLSRWLDPTGIHCMDVCPDEELVDRKTIETVKQGDEIRPRCPHCGLVAEWTGYEETGIHWVIGGGESGAKARPMHPDWARSLRDQCQAAGVPFFFKQWGEWSYGRSEDGYPEDKPLTCMKADGTLSWWAGNEDTTFNHSTNYKETDSPIERVGKAAAGALLDGREWKEFPEVTS